MTQKNPIDDTVKDTKPGAMSCDGGGDGDDNNGVPMKSSVRLEDDAAKVQTPVLSPCESALPKDEKKTAKSVSKFGHRVQDISKQMGTVAVQSAAVLTKKTTHAVKKGSSSAVKVLGKPLQKRHTEKRGVSHVKFEESTHNTTDLVSGIKTEHLCKNIHDEKKPTQLKSGMPVDCANPDSAFHIGNNTLLVPDNDQVILWVLVFSIVASEVWKHIDTIIAEKRAPLSVVLSLMLLAFTGGLELDCTVLLEDVKYYVLGPRLMKKNHRCLFSDGNEDSTSRFENVVTTIESIDGLEHESSSRSLRFFRRMVRKPKLQKPQTILKHPNRVTRYLSYNIALLKRLSSKDMSGPRIEDTDIHNNENKMESKSVGSGQEINGSLMSHEIGRINMEQSGSTLMHQKMGVHPLGKLRGLDVFLSDCPDAEMSTHPFLLQNGLRDVPTFLANLMTPWGCILIYFELPHWVRDKNGCLVENENDTDSTKALKRFLKGSNEYRKQRLKLVFEFSVAPLPVRMIAPKDAEMSTYSPGLTENHYHSSGDDGNCPIWEVTFDFVSNKTIRGLAAIVKRSLRSMSIDLGLVISNENEPKAVLGLWRFDHLDISVAPILPSRINDSTTEQADTTLARQLVREASERVSIASLS